MRQGYYYLITSLPELNLTDKNPVYDLLRFREFIWDELTPHDKELFSVLFYLYDIENLVKLIKETNTRWHPFGNFSQEDLTNILKMPDGLPEFLQNFIADTRKLWERASAKKLINLATTYFIGWSQHVPNAFLKKWLYFDQNLKNLLIWLNCHKFGLNPEEEVLGNHYEAQYLRSVKPDAIDLHAWDFQFREVLRHYDNPDIALRESIINEMRWHYLGEISSTTFGIERLLAYAIKLQLINRNFTDTELSGQQRLGALLDSVTKNYRVPENF
ncbi:MAG: DUF2764 family protein [Cyclobacteriaceae bacterium]|nr:DUF2764 family protein [Cyclobacteriaceae bacterium]UYN85229.1 MAG: DUF2764 family protein [Cyclobacteriaceae bacterium]